MHNSSLTAKDTCYEYRQRGETEQFFDRLKNKLYTVLKHTPLNKAQKPNHKYSITDTVEHLETVKKIKFTENESVITELDKSTKILLEKMKIDIT